MKYMKKTFKTIRLIMVTMLLVLAGQVSLFAADNQNTATLSTLSSAQILSGFAILLLAILLPLLKKRPKVVYYRIIKTYKRK